MRRTNELKKSNLLEIAKAIWKNGAITKTQAANQSNLTVVTAHNFINDLLKKKFLKEDGSTNTNGGRNATLYRVDGSFGLIVGQLLGVHYIETTIHNVALQRLYVKKIEVNLDYSPSVIELMFKQVEIAMEAVKCDADRLLGIGIALPGQVNRRDGVVINLTHIPDWRGVKLKKMFEDKFAANVYIDNDTNATILAAKWRGIVEEDANAVFLSITNGMSSAILTKGKVLYGNHSNVGEIGHTTVQYNGPLCECGGRGCLELMVSEQAIIQKLTSYYSSQSVELPFIENLTIDSVIRLAQEGDAAALQALKEAAFFISLALDKIIKMYDPETIVVENKWLRLFPDLFRSMIDQVFRRCAWFTQNDLNIVLNPVEDIASGGPSALVIDELFMNADEHENRLLKKLMG